MRLASCSAASRASALREGRSTSTVVSSSPRLADTVRAPGGGQQGGREDVLAGVLGPEVRPARCVHFAGDFGAFGGLERRGQQMQHFFPADLHVRHRDAVQCAPVRGLAAALGVEGGGLQYHRPARRPGLLLRLLSSAGGS